jgi:D-alanyl-D-alanine carboxypeptidase
MSILIPPDNPTPPERFPVLLQLSVLGCVLVGGFALLWLFADRSETEPAMQFVTQPLPSLEENLLQINFEKISLIGEAAVIIDAQTGEVLFEKNADTVLPLASITKLMTALLDHELTTNTNTVQLGDEAIAQEGYSGLDSGETFTNTALRAMALVPSSNDAAHGLAADTGTVLGDRAAAAQFVAAMNIRAEELGFATLSFQNATGLDESETAPGAVGSALDVSKLVQHMLRQTPELLAETTRVQAQIDSEAGQTHIVRNTNVIADRIPNLLASKTGYTDLAGGNLVVAYDAGFDRPLIITVLGSTFDGRFTDVLTLIESVEVNSVL